MNKRLQDNSHFYQRCAFGMSMAEWRQAHDREVVDTVKYYFDDIEKQLLKNETSKSDFDLDEDMYAMSRKELKKEIREDKKLLHAPMFNWVKQMSDPDRNPVLERITLFWHGHFACQTIFPHLKSRQLYTLRRYALGSFRSMVKAISRDSAMLLFLNNQQNRKGHPNENYARELMELFTIGKGNYTEEDVKEAARAFTGWQSNLKGEFFFNEKQHDEGIKTFMNITNNHNGDDIIDILLNKKETATHITRKVWRHFVSEQEDELLIQSLAKKYFDSDYDNQVLFKEIFTSEWFYDKKYQGKRIKSPIELIAGIMKTMNIDFYDNLGLLFLQHALGQVLFFPPNVAGWKEGKSWINSATLNFRLNLVQALLQKEDLDIHTKDEFEALDRNAAFRNFKVDINTDTMTQYFLKKENDEIFSEMKSWLLSVPISQEISFFQTYLLKKDKQEFIKSMMIRFMSMPEYQLC